MLFILAAAAVKIVPWIIGGAVAIYATKKVTQSFGSTPANDAKQAIPQLAKMSPKELYQDRKRWKEDRINYHKEKQEKIQSEIDKLNKKIELEQEEKTKLAQKEQETSDPAEKQRYKALQIACDKKIADLTGKVRGLEKNKQEGEKKIDEVYGNFRDDLTQEQFVQEANSINWKSYKNYFIIGICLIVCIMLIGVIKKLFNSLLSSVK